MNAQILMIAKTTQIAAITMFWKTGNVDTSSTFLGTGFLGTGLSSIRAQCGGAQDTDVAQRLREPPAGGSRSECQRVSASSVSQRIVSE